MLALAVVMGMIGVGAVFLLVRAWVLMLFWQWFVVPVFPVRALGLVEAFGLTILIGYLTQNPQTWQGREQDTTRQNVLRIVGVLLLPLVVGWLLHELLLRNVGIGG